MTNDKTQRKERPITRGVLDYFPDAIAEVAHVSFVGNQQHNPGEPMHWARGKSADHEDCIARHLLERGTLDTDGLRHSAKIAWRALALLQTELEEAACKVELTLAKPAPVFEPGTVQADDFGRLLAMGCPAHVAEQIIKGTTYAGNDYLRNMSYSSPYVYVAGPMRGYEKFNFPAFDAARDALVRMGYNVISPADIDRATEVTVDPATLDVTDQTRFVFRDFWAIYFLKKIDLGKNGLALLPGWKNSTGATSEFGLARWLDLTFYAKDGFHYFHNRGKCPKGFLIGGDDSCEH